LAFSLQLKRKEGPTPYVTWYHNGEAIKERPKEIVINQTEEGVCTLKIAEVFPEGKYSQKYESIGLQQNVISTCKFSDSGNYFCRATNRPAVAEVSITEELLDGNDVTKAVVNVKGL